MSKVKIELDVSGNTSQIDQLNARVTELGKSLDSQNKKAAKGAKLAAGSYQALEKELKDNEKQLKRLTAGTKEFTAQKAKVDQLRQAHAKVKTEVVGTSTSMKKSQGVLGGVTKGAVALGGAFTTVLGVASQITTELERHKKLQTTASITTQTLDESLAKASVNLTPEQIPLFKNVVREGALAAGVKQEPFAAVLANNLGAGAVDLTEADKAARLAFNASGGQSAEAMEMAAVALDFRGKSGLNITEAMGLVPQTARFSRATDQSQNFGNITPAVLAGTTNRANIDGVELERSLELITTFAKTTKDRTGSDSAQAGRDFFTKLDAFIPDATGKLKDGSKSQLSNAEIAAYTGTRLVDARVDMMRSNPRLAAQFVDTLGESKSTNVIRQAVTGDAEFMANEQLVRGGVDITTAGQDLLKQIDLLSKNTRVGRTVRFNEANLEYGQTTGSRAIVGAARAAFDNTLDDINQPGIDAFENFGAAGTGFRGMLSPAMNSPLQQLENMKARAAGIQQDTFFGFGGVNEEDRGKLQRLEGTLTDAINSLKEEQAKANNLAREQLDVQRQQLGAQQAPNPSARQPAPRAVKPAAAGAL